MAQLEQRPSISVEISLRVTEQEARALDALVGYGSKAFLEVFYKHLGEGYMKPHEEGLKSFFASIREYVPPVLERADKARLAFASGLSARQLERWLAAPDVPARKSAS